MKVLGHWVVAEGAQQTNYIQVLLFSVHKWPPEDGLSTQRESRVTPAWKIALCAEGAVCF